MWEKIKAAYWRFKKNAVSIGIAAALAALFTGHIFTTVVIGTVTYLFWRNEHKVDQLVGTV